MTTRDKTTKVEGKTRQKEIVLHGIGVSPGVVEGKVFLVGVEADHYLERTISREEVPGEIARFEDALIETRIQIREIQKSVEAQMTHADPGILDVHLMVLDDRAFVHDVVQQIRTNHRNVEQAIWVVASKYADALAGVGDDYLRERVADIKDVARRIVRSLAGNTVSALGELREKSVIVAHDLAPSETASLSKRLVLGVATDIGSPTSHSAMLARAMEIPAVVGMHDITRKVLPGTRILIDGNKGVVIIQPSPQSLRIYGKVAAERKHIESGLSGLRNSPAETKGGARVSLMANIEKPGDVDAVIQYGGEGIGLYRTEYHYMASPELPSEDELAADYENVAARLGAFQVVIRTLDIGGDKFVPYAGLKERGNPFLGLRSIRLSLAEPAIFKTQLRAILRANSRGNVKLMYPMVSSAEEVIQANLLLEEAKRELRTRGVKYRDDIQVGAMIETPSAALTSEIIAPHVKFFSIGTNDLVQYTMAVDRSNEQVAYLYQPTHPAILRLIKETVDVGRRRQMKVSVCGEMAADPVLCPLLIGLGVEELSVPPSAIPVVKDAIRSVTISDAEELARRALMSSSAADILTQCRELIGRTAPEILELTK